MERIEEKLNLSSGYSEPSKSVQEAMREIEYFYLSLGKPPNTPGNAPRRAHIKSAREVI